MRREILDGRPWVMTLAEHEDHKAWMRAFDLTSGSRPTRIQIVINEPPPQRVVHPCDLGRHRWAWLVSGGQACGICGRPR